MPPRVTTLNLVAQADPTMKFPLKTLKALISSRKEAVVHENLTMSDELDDMNDKDVRPIMVHYVHGGPALSRSERS